MGNEKSTRNNAQTEVVITVTISGPGQELTESS